MPFFDDARRWSASNHFESGMCEASKTVPTVTVNCLRHALHFDTPLRVLLPLFGVSLYGSKPPRCGHAGLPFQRSCSSSSRAASSSEKCLASFERLSAPSMNSTLHTHLLVCQVLRRWYENGS